MKLKSAQKNREYEPAVGANADLPEGIFGILDDISPLFTPESLHETPWDKEQKRRTSERRKRDSRSYRKAIKARSLEINRDAYSDDLPNLQYENTIEVPEELLTNVKRKTDIRTKDFSQMLMSRVLPSLLGLDAAQSYVTSAMRDGLGIEVEFDDSVLEAVKGLTNLDLLFYFIRRSSLPKKYKHRFLSTVVEETAKSAVLKMDTRDKSEASKKHMKELQSLIVRGVSSATRKEDKSRRAGEDDNAHMESPYGFEMPAREIGAIRTRRRT